MRHKQTRDLYVYWDDTRGERAAPERRDIDPVALRHILGDIFMLDVGTTGQCPLALCGERFSGLIGKGLKGQDFLDIWSSPERGQIAALCASVCDDALPIVAGIRAAPEGRAPVALEMLLLPLRHFGKTHERILGVISPASTPDWLGVLPVVEFSLVSMRVLAPSSQRRRAGPARNWVSRQGEIPIASDFMPLSRHRHLTVYEGGKNAAN